MEYIWIIINVINLIISSSLIGMSLMIVTMVMPIYTEQKVKKLFRKDRGKTGRVNTKKIKIITVICKILLFGLIYVIQCVLLYNMMVSFPIVLDGIARIINVLME